MVASLLSVQAKSRLKNRNWEHSLQSFLYIFTALYQKLLFGFVLAETQKQNVALLLLCVYLPPPPPFCPPFSHSFPVFVAFFCEFEKIFACIHRSGVGCVCEICKCRTHIMDSEISSSSRPYTIFSYPLSFSFSSSYFSKCKC